MLIIKNVKKLRDNFEKRIQEKFARLSNLADKNPQISIGCLISDSQELLKELFFLEKVYKYLRNPEPYLEQEIEEYLL
jgi:hypothetical protein